LRVVLLAIDAAAGAILHPFDAEPFGAVQAIAIGAVAGFHPGDAGLLAFQPGGFARGKAAPCDTTRNTMLLVMLALVDARFGRQGGESGGTKGKGDDCKTGTHEKSPQGMGIILRA
jgi:hypothetical protein